MSGLKTLLTAVRGPGEFASILDELRGIYGGLAMSSSKGQKAERLRGVRSRLAELEGREAAANQKKLAYLKLIHEALESWDQEQYYRAYDIESKFNRMNASNKGETVEYARKMIPVIIRRMKERMETQHHLITLQMLHAQGKGTPAQEAEKDEIFRIAGVVRGKGAYTLDEQKRLTVVMARKQIGLPLNGSADGGLERVISDKASLLMAGLMPQVPSQLPRGMGTGLGNRGGRRKTRRARGKRRKTTRRHR